MKLQLTLLALVAAAAASPVAQKNRDEGSVIIVPLEREVYDMDDGDSGVFSNPFYSFNPFGNNPLAGFMQNMDAMLKNLREQMNQVLQRLPNENTEWKEIGEGKGNTTSTVKVINGHKVTINETTYANEGDNTGSFFKIRVVDVHPTSEEDTSDEIVKSKQSSNGNRDVEKVTTDSNDLSDKGSPEILESANEIPQGKPEKENALTMSNEIETLGEDFKTDILPDESIQSYKITGPEYTFSSGEELADPIREIETNDVNSNFDIDLSNDIYVNQMMADANAEPNPDAELIDVELLNAQSKPEKLTVKDRVIPEAIITTYPDHLWPVLYTKNRS